MACGVLIGGIFGKFSFDEIILFPTDPTDTTDFVLCIFIEPVCNIISL